MYLYKPVKENDGTYTIRQSKFGLNWEIIRCGVRGCNVNRVINKYHKNDCLPFLRGSVLSIGGIIQSN